MEIHPMGFWLFHADGWTDNKANNCFCNFAKVPKNQWDATS